MRKAISVCFRVDADEKSGLGHLSRCRSLMVAFSKAGKCCFSVISHNKDLVKKFMANIKFDFYDVGRACQEKHFNMLIVDVPDIATKGEDYLRGLSDVTVGIDDNESGLDFQDILIRPNLLNFPRPSRISLNNYWSGRDYIILHPDFTAWACQKREKSGEVKKIFVCFGGSDQLGITLRVIPLLKKLEMKIAMHIILGAAFTSKKQVVDMVNNDSRFLVVHNIPHMALFLEKADLALISGGTLLYEACSLGVPSVVISQNRGQDVEAKICHNQGAVISLGLNKVVSDKKILRTLQQIINNDVLRKKMSIKGFKSVSSDGAERIVSRLLLRVKEEGRL